MIQDKGENPQARKFFNTAQESWRNH